MFQDLTFKKVIIQSILLAIGVLLMQLLLEPLLNYLIGSSYSYFELVERASIRIIDYDLSKIVILIFVSILGGIGFAIYLERRKRKKHQLTASPL